MVQIRRKNAQNVWEHIDQNGRKIILSKAYISTVDNSIDISEINGSDKVRATLSEIEVYDDASGGGVETFPNTLALITRLKQLGYPYFDESNFQPANELIEKAKINASGLNVCAYGQDSLTQGAGGFTFRDEFDVKYRGAFGKSEIGYVHIDHGSAIDNGAGFGKSTDLLYMLKQGNSNGFDSDPIQYSPSGRGLYVDNGSNENFSWNTNKHFTKARLYYLQRPGGGSFKYGFSNIPSADRQTQSMDGSLSIQYVELDRTVNDTTIIVVNEINGQCAFFGFWFFIDDDSSSVLSLATGGMKLESQLDLNSSFRQTWFGIFTPAVYLLNTGTNDRNTLSADDFETKLRSYCNDVIIGSPNTKLIIVEPNQPADYNTSNAHLFTSRRIKVSNDLDLDYLDLPRIIGDYNYFVSNQMMLDGVHPNKKGVDAIAKAQLEYLGIQNYGNFSEIPDDQFSGGAEAVNKLSGNIQRYSATDLDSGTEYTAYTLGFINGYIGFYFDITVYLRLSSSSRMRAKKLRFFCGNSTVDGNASIVGQLTFNDDYQSHTSGTIPNATFTLAIENNKAVLKYTPSHNLESVSISGTWQASQEVNTAAELVRYF